MKKSYVVFDFLKYYIPGKVVKGRNVILKMDGNPSFPNPDVPLNELKEATDILENSYLAAQRGGKEETARMHQAEEDWNYKMRLEALYAERMARLDEATILSAGFNVSKRAAPAQKTELSAEAGEKPCSVLLRRQAVPGAKAYLWQYCINKVSETEEGWSNSGATSKATVLLENLLPVTRYWFRVATVSIEGTSAYSEPVMHFVV